MACASRDLATAEIAYAAINEVRVCVCIKVLELFDRLYSTNSIWKLTLHVGR